MALLGICDPPSQNEGLFVEQIKLALNTYIRKFFRFR